MSQTPRNHRALLSRADLVQLLATAELPLRELALAAMADRVVHVPPERPDPPPIQEPIDDSTDGGPELDRTPPVETVPLAAVPFYFATEYTSLVQEQVSVRDQEMLSPRAPTRPAQPMPEPTFTPLSTKAATLTALRKNSAVRRPGRDLFLERIIERISRCEQLERLPRRPRRAWGRGLHLLQDRATRLTPFWQDQGQVFAWLTQVYPCNSIQLLRSRDEHLEFWTVAPQFSYQYVLPTPGTPVIVLSDLGCFATNGDRLRQFWLRWGQRFRENNNPTLALVPTTEANISHDLKKVWTVLPWGARAAAGTSARSLERLLSLLAPLVRLEPALLRAIRMLLPEYADDPAWEARVWTHPLVTNPHSAAASLDVTVQQHYLERFASEEPTLQQAVLDLIERWHRRIHEAIWAETIVRLPFASQQHFAELCTGASHFFDTLASEQNSETVNVSTSAWASRIVQRSRNCTLADNRLQRAFNSFYQWARPQTALSESPIWFQPDFAGSQPQQDFAIAVYHVDERLWLERIPSESQTTYSTTRSPLARLHTHNDQFVIRTMPPLTKETSFWQTGRPLSWASRWGQDSKGHWAEFTVGGVTQRMRWIPSGKFLMGSPETEAGRDEDEGPQHEVVISKGYWLFDTPCTQELWEAVLGGNANQSRFRDARRPVENVNWKEAQDFIQKLNEHLPDLQLRLPSEAEWEYACRAGTSKATYNGDLELLGRNNVPNLDAIAWYAGNSGHDYDLDEGDDSKGWKEKQYPHIKAGTRRVGLKRPNGWGLYDMLGNVWEWCHDGLRTYTNQQIVDPMGPITSDAPRVIRGGSWATVARLVRAAYRNANHPVDRDVNLGLRCLSSGEGPEKVAIGSTWSVSEPAENATRAPQAHVLQFLGQTQVHFPIPQYDRFEVVSDSDRVEFRRQTKPEWAKSMGRDRFGLWAEITIGTVVQRLRWIPPGRFLMGSPASENGRSDNEGPQHEVVISTGYWLFDTPCTQEFWLAVVGGQNPSRFQDPRRPVERVSWNETTKFFEKLNDKLPGLSFRLPSEAEWEYACRAGTSTATYNGDLKLLGRNNAPILDAIAWYAGNSGHDYDLDEGDDSKGWKEKQYPHIHAGTRRVGLKRPNGWGLYDMLGNVWEWCSDVWRTNYDAPIPQDESVALRVIRGGGWRYVARRVRAASRNAFHPDNRDDVLGFRCLSSGKWQEGEWDAERPSRAEREATEGSASPQKVANRKTPPQTNTPIKKKPKHKQ